MPFILIFIIVGVFTVGGIIGLMIGVPRIIRACRGYRSVGL